MTRPALDSLEASGSVVQVVPSLEAIQSRHDFGRVPIGGGRVQTRFRIRNAGPGPVELESLATSCGCTSAYLEFSDGSEAGPFGLTGEGLRTEVHRTVSEGESLSLRVVFDPAAHGPAGTGRIAREVILSGRNGGQARVLITAEVVEG